MQLDEALTRYKERRGRYKQASRDVKSRLEDLAREAHITVTILAREKDVASYRAKVIEKSYQDAWAEVTDKAGARVIVTMPSEVDAFVAAMQASDLSLVGDPEDKREVTDPEQLSYSGVHVQVVAPPNEGDDEAVECEVQVRTAAQDAWSVASHKLLYKPVVQLPKAEQHAIYRLVALMELFDLEVERVSSIIPSLPGYEFRDVLAAAEAEFLGIAHAQSYRSLSVQTLEALGSEVPTSDEYPDVLRAFVHENRDMLRDAVTTYGPLSDLNGVYAYTLFSQAELLIVLERLANRPHAFAAAWRDSGLPPIWLQTVSTYCEADLSEL